MCCLGFSRFFFSRISLLLLTRTLLHQSEKHFDKKERILGHFGVVLFKRRDFETTRFSFSFLLRRSREKKIHSRQKESFHLLLQKRARALKEHRHTRAHTKPRDREREKDDAFFFFSDRVVCLFCVRIICEDHREREREKTFYHLASL